MAGVVNVVYLYESVETPTPPPTNPPTYPVAIKVIVGDTNNDDLISIRDVIHMMKFLISDSTPTDIQKATMDVNNDSSFSVSDVIFIMRYSIGHSDCANVGKEKVVHIYTALS